MEDKKELWVILADFDDEPDIFFGNSSEVLQYIERWDDYRWEEIEYAGNELQLDGFTVDNEVSVSFRAFKGYTNQVFASQVYELLKDFDDDQKLQLSNLIKRDSELGTNATGHALYHNIMSGAELPYYAREAPIELEPISLEEVYEDQYSISFTQDFGLED